MKLVKTSVEQVTRRVSEVSFPDGSTIVVVDTIRGNEIIDTIYRDSATGREVESAITIELVDEFLKENGITA